MPTMNYAAAAPEIFLGLAICVVLLVDVFLRDDQRNVTYVLAMLALIGTAAMTAIFARHEHASSRSAAASSPIPRAAC